MSADLVLWRWGPIDENVVLDTIKGADDHDYLLHKGVALAADFPTSAKLPMKKDRPLNTVLTDNLFNMNRLLVISAPLKEFLEKRKVRRVEFLPVQIIDHKRRVVKREYCIANPFDPVDCVDLKKSGAVIDQELLPGTIESVKRLVLNPSRIDPDREVFSAKNLRQVVFVTRSLADAIDSAGFKGMRWLELSDYGDE